MKILISDNLSNIGVELLRRHENFTVDKKVGLKPEELRKIIGEYDALIVRSETRVTADLIAAGERLRVIGRAGTGVDNIDVPAATQRGIVVMNAAGGNSVTTAEHTIALLMAMARRIPQAAAKLKAGKWDKKSFMGTELNTKTLGIIGLGNIGRIVASRGQGLGMKVIAYDPFLTKDAAQRSGVEMVTLDELFSRSDFITVHTPLTDETRGIIGEAAFAKMKDGVRIINCARGGLVDENALVAAIKAGRVAGAALDVFVEEPPPADHPLLGLDEVVVTPHLGASTTEAQESVAVTIAEQVAAYLLNGSIGGAVNVPAVSGEVLETLRPYLTLGEKLGSFQTQFFGHAFSEVRISYSGDVASLDVRSITRAILTGLLKPVSARVNQVNATLIAEERGIRVSETIATAPHDFTSLIELTVRDEESESRIAGTLFGKNDMRIVMINSHRLEAVPQGNMLVVVNDDLPGVVGKTGTFLGDHNINIAQMYLSRTSPGGVAVSVYQVDQTLDAATLAALGKVPQVLSVKQITL
ncbi:MAG TPA: phosphoglycerate dehydrogenase [Blastocatellia bacterium]|nr:phosphoglycerate dehydrogenase [Blastocatellia bacterium]